MPIIPVTDLSKGGVIKDQPDLLLPQNVFSDGLNVTFRNGSIATIKGEQTINEFAPSIYPSAAIFWPRTSETALIVGDTEGHIRRMRPGGIDEEMLDNADYFGGEWQMDLFGGGYAAFANNFRATPVYCLQNGPGTTDTKMEPFPGWVYAPFTKVLARVIRPFGYSLVAGNFVFYQGSSITRAPVTIRLSVQAPVGSFPEIWKPGLTTDTADEFELNSRSPIQDMKELRGQMFIYCYDSIHVLQMSNGFPIVREYAQGKGCLDLGCVTVFENQHFVVDRSDIYIHNGSGQLTSPAQGRMRDYFLQDCNFDLMSWIFVHHEIMSKEIWVCYVSKDAADNYCDRALIYNYADDNFTIRTLPRIRGMVTSRAFSGFLFNQSTPETWGLLSGSSGTKRILRMSAGYKMFNRTEEQFVSYPSYIQKDRMCLSNNPFESVQIQGIAPVLEFIDSGDHVIDKNTSLELEVRSQNIYDGEAIDWQNPPAEDATRSTFEIKPRDTKQGYLLSPRRNGRFLSYRLSSAAAPWRLSFMGLDIKGEQKR